MKATEGNGGAPIVLSKALLDRPIIPRGEILGPVQRDDDGVIMHSLVTFTQPAFGEDGSRWLATYHGALVVGQASDEEVGLYLWLIDVGPEVVVTWEQISGVDE